MKTMGFFIGVGGLVVKAPLMLATGTWTLLQDVFLGTVKSPHHKMHMYDRFIY